MRFSGPQYARENEVAAPRATWPSHDQPRLPGIVEPESEQMRLFDTHRAGPSNVYALNPSMTAADWTDRDKQVELDEDEQNTLEDGGSLGRGNFYTFDSPAGSSEREYLAFRDAHRRGARDLKEQGRYLGADAYPEQVNPDLRFEDLHVEEDGGERRYLTPEGTEVGKVSWHDDEWGPYVDTAEINSLYRGRKFARDAIVGFAQDHGEEGVVHAGSYTDDGERAFHARGVPTSSDLEDAFGRHIEFLDPDEDLVLERAMEQYPDEEPDFWDTEGGESYLSEIRENMRYDMQYNDPDVRDDFKQNLVEMQSTMLANLERSKPGNFVPGFKPKGKTWGTQEKLL